MEFRQVWYQCVLCFPPCDVQSGNMLGYCVQMQLRPETLQVIISRPGIIRLLPFGLSLFLVQGQHVHTISSDVCSQSWICLAPEPSSSEQQQDSRD